MGFHTFDVERADRLEDAARRYESCSREELHELVAPHQEMTLADLGSGTGFFTEELAPSVERLYAVDVQPDMHALYREKGVSESVLPVCADVESLPFDSDVLDAAFSTMTYHEFASDVAFAELSRVLRPGGRLVTVDWSATGTGERGPPLEERYDLGDAVAAHVDNGFAVDRATSRPETFVCVARNAASGP